MDASPRTGSTRGVTIAADEAYLEGELTVPDGAVAIVAFAHDGGSSRDSPRNRRVAEHLNDVGLATLLFDLLTPDEEAEDRRTRELRFDVSLLGRRLGAAIDWLDDEPSTAPLTVGCFGASTGAAAALIAAAQRPDRVRAVVSRGGRPDLADDVLHQVQAPTLLIVGANDPIVLDLNRRAQAAVSCEARVEVVPGAGHLFEEPGALERVAGLARDWLLRHLGRSPDPPAERHA